MKYRTAGELVASFIGTQNDIIVPVAILKQVGDLEAAILLSQIVYWSEQTHDGWFAKSFPEWEDVICLSRHQINRALDYLKAIEINGCALVESKKARSEAHNFAPTIHYRYNRDVLQLLLEGGL